MCFQEFDFIECGNVEVAVTQPNLINFVLLTCAKVVLRSEKLQIVLAGTNLPSCVATTHGVERARKAAGKEPEVEEEDRHICLVATINRFSSTRSIAVLRLGRKDRSVTL
ncbi:hypothetical protein Trydic_g11748 [Trypoxylus dichotomus]